MADNLISNLSKIKQPSPSFVKDGDKNAATSNTTPVAKTPIISTMPMLDSYIKKKEEHPKIQQKVKLKKLSYFNFEDISTALIVILGTVSLGKTAKGLFNFIKSKR